ncbi:MAG TPA: hypothetical protein VF458_07075 [Ktedonobacteraceae bacterium]
MSKPLTSGQRFFDRQSVFFALLVSACLLSASLIFAFWADSWTLWPLGFLLIAAWLPLVISTTRAISRRYPWLAFLYVLVVAQSAHMLEHLSQAVEIHLLGWPAPMANGIIGFLNIEWVHLIWNSWVLLAVGLLLFAYRRNIALWGLFAFAIFHEAEHVYMVTRYIQTGHPGNPGFLAHGGLIGGGLPLSRPDLHTIYAVLETAMLFMIYFMERKKFQMKQAQQVSTAAAQVSAG